MSAKELHCYDISVTDIRRRLREIIAAVEAGQAMCVVTKRGWPVAEIVPPTWKRNLLKENASTRANDEPE